MQHFAQQIWEILKEVCFHKQPGCIKTKSFNECVLQICLLLYVKFTNLFMVHCIHQDHIFEDDSLKDRETM